MTVLTTEQLQTEVTKLLQALIGFLGKLPVEDDMATLLSRYKKLKAELGNKQTAERLGLNLSEVEDFNRAMRELERSGPDSKLTGRNQLLVQLRFISWMESLGRNHAELQIPADIQSLISEELGRKQVRALELILRSMIN